MITDSQRYKWKIIKTEEIEEKIDNSISNHETRFLNLHRLIAFTILVTFKSFVIRP